MAKASVPANRGPEQIEHLLSSAEIAAFVTDLESTRRTGRPGYAIRTMVGMALMKSLLRPPDVDPHGCPRERLRRVAEGHRRHPLG